MKKSESLATEILQQNMKQIFSGRQSPNINSTSQNTNDVRKSSLSYTKLCQNN